MLYGPVDPHVLWRRRLRSVYGIHDESFDGGSVFGHLFRSEEVYECECQSEVEDADGEVHAQCIPAVGFDEQLQSA